MDLVALVAVIMLFGIPLVAIVAGIGGITLVILKIIRASSGGDRKLGAEEAKMIQDIYHGLLKMEERVESLETILLERERKGSGT